MLFFMLGLASLNRYQDIIKTLIRQLVNVCAKASPLLMRTYGFCQ